MASTTHRRGSVSTPSSRGQAPLSTTAAASRRRRSSVASTEQSNVGGGGGASAASKTHKWGATLAKLRSRLHNLTTITATLEGGVKAKFTAPRMQEEEVGVIIAEFWVQMMSNVQRFVAANSDENVLNMLLPMEAEGQDSANEAVLHGRLHPRVVLRNLFLSRYHLRSLAAKALQQFKA